MPPLHMLSFPVPHPLRCGRMRDRVKFGEGWRIAASPVTSRLACTTGRRGPTVSSLVSRAPAPTICTRHKSWRCCRGGRWVRRGLQGVVVVRRQRQRWPVLGRWHDVPPSLVVPCRPLCTADPQTPLGPVRTCIQRLCFLLTDNHPLLWAHCLLMLLTADLTTALPNVSPLILQRKQEKVKKVCRALDC